MDCFRFKFPRSLTYFHWTSMIPRQFQSSGCRNPRCDQEMLCCSLYKLINTDVKRTEENQEDLIQFCSVLPANDRHSPKAGSAQEKWACSITSTSGLYSKKLCKIFLASTIEDARWFEKSASLVQGFSQSRWKSWQENAGYSLCLNS